MNKDPENVLDPEDELIFTYPDENEDEAYERQRQQEIDDEFERSVADELVRELEDIGGVFKPGFMLKEQAE